MLGLLVGQRTDGYVVETVDLGSGTGEQNRGVRRDDELSVTGPAIGTQNLEQFKLTAWRKRSLGFIEQVESPDPVPVAEIGHQRLTMGLGYQ